MGYTKLYKNQYYQGSLSNEQCEMLLGIRSAEKVESLKHSITNLTPTEIAELAEKKDFKNTVPYTGTLRDDQTVTVAFMYYGVAVLIGDEVGLGKTVEVSGLINVLYEEKKRQGKPFNVLFLSESTSIGELWRKLLQFTGRYIALMSTGETKTVRKFIKSVGTEYNDNWSAVAPHSIMRNAEFLSFCATHSYDLIIFDESGVLRNNKGSSEIYRNTKLLLNRTERKILLNATPMEIGLRDFYNQLALLDADYLPKITEFESLYCIKRRVSGRYKIVGTRNLDLLRKAISLRYFAHTRADLGAKYEDNTVRMMLLELSDAQKHLQSRTSLWQQLFDYPPAIMYDVDATLENIPKIWGLLCLLKKIDTDNEQVLVYCKYLECQDRLKYFLELYGYNVAILNGSTGVKKREEILSDFKQRRYNILLTNTMRSLDLSYCSHCVLYTIDTSPLRAVQVEGRITREFDVVGKNLWLLVMRGREEKALFGVAKERANAAKGATTQGRSLYLKLLLQQDTEVIKIPKTAYKAEPQSYSYTTEKLSMEQV